MNNINVKVVLYAFPLLDKVIQQIDELVFKKAITSIDDFSPCYNQCEKILSLTEQKKKILNIKKKLQRIVNMLTEREKLLLDCKYFHQRKNSDYKGLELKSRKYYREQNTVLVKFSNLLEEYGVNDVYMEREMYSIRLFRELYRRTKDVEEKKQNSRNKFILTMYNKSRDVRRVERRDEILKVNYS